MHPVLRLHCFVGFGCEVSRFARLWYQLQRKEIWSKKISHKVENIFCNAGICLYDA